MNSNANPSLNPADNDSLAGAFRHIVNKMMQNANTMLPAKVLGYQPSSTGDRVQVQPLITVVDTLGNQIPRAQIASVPVVRLGGGGFIVSFPLNPGDLGWIIANDRDISQFLQTYAISPPNTTRKNNFSDAIFIPAAMTGYTIAGGDLTNFVIQNLDGTVKISLSNTTITLESPSGTIINNLSAQNITLSGGVTPNFTGNLFVNGNIQATGTITPNVPP